MRIIKYLLKIFVIQIIIAIYPLHGHALEKSTHGAMNRYIAENTVRAFSLDRHLKDQLGFSNGKDETFNNRKVFEWLDYGGWKEDEPLYRSFRHYHNPLQTWDKAGLKRSAGGRSSIIWAQSTDQSWGHYAWQDARVDFYFALTSKDRATREAFFADLFRGLGQQMHLIEDASVPLHTRDDVHIFYSYEDWVQDFRENNPDIFNSWMSKAQTYDQSIFDFPSNPLAPIPIARITDTDQYTGADSDIDMTVSSAIGLAEYSNANFFSQDTIFDEDFPFPRRESVAIAEYEIEDPRDPSQTVTRQYYHKVRHGETGYRLATVGFLNDFIPADLQGLPDAVTDYDYEKPALDEHVYRDYAERLIPRAVGYSAGLLQYCFRGTLEVELEDGGLMITNTSRETLHDGRFELYYDNEAGQRRLIDFVLRRPVPIMGPDESTDILFEEPGDAAFYVVVWKGGLGEEAEAVVGKVAPAIPMVQLGLEKTSIKMHESIDVWAYNGVPPYSFSFIGDHNGDLAPTQTTAEEERIAYRAGSQEGTDTIQVMDSLGNTAERFVLVKSDTSGGHWSRKLEFWRGPCGYMDFQESTGSITVHRDILSTLWNSGHHDPENTEIVVTAFWGRVYNAPHSKVTLSGTIGGTQTPEIEVEWNDYSDWMTVELGFEDPLNSDSWQPFFFGALSR